MATAYVPECKQSRGGIAVQVATFIRLFNVIKAYQFVGLYIIRILCR